MMFQHVLSAWFMMFQHVLSAWFMMFQHVLSAWFMMFQHVLSAWFKTFQYVLSAWFKTFQYVLSAWFKTFQYVINILKCLKPSRHVKTCFNMYNNRFIYSNGSWVQKYFNIALVLKEESLTIFTRPANTCTCPLKAHAIKNIRV